MIFYIFYTLILIVWVKHPYKLAFYLNLYRTVGFLSGQQWSDIDLSRILAVNLMFISELFDIALYPVSILCKSIAGRYRPVRVADGPITTRYRFIKNASWVANPIKKTFQYVCFILGENFSTQHFCNVFSHFSQKAGFAFSCKSSKPNFRKKKS